MPISLAKYYNNLRSAKNNWIKMSFIFVTEYIYVYKDTQTDFSIQPMLNNFCKPNNININ